MNEVMPLPNSSAEASPQHWVIAYASSHVASLQQALATLYLPHLEKVMQGMACVAKSDLEVESIAPLLPHEHAPTLWHQAPNWGDEALITPCHWQVGMNEVLLLNPSEMHLSQEESQQLLATVKPYFEEDGLHLSYESPLIWRANGPLLKDMSFASLAKVAGQHIQDWLPKGPHARTLQRLQSEMQMLLYQHPVNDHRSQQGRWGVNSFWVHRSMEQLYPNQPATAFRMDLQEAANSGNAKQWQGQWQALDKLIGESFKASPKQIASLTLCSETHWRHYRPYNPTWLQALKRSLSPLKVQTELRALTAGVSDS